MPQYVLPADTAACFEPAGILAQDQRKVPHVVRTKAKMRTMGFYLRVTGADNPVIGMTSVLLGFLPAGRNRILWELSYFGGTVSTLSKIEFGDYICGDRAEITVPKHEVVLSPSAGAYLKGSTIMPGSANMGMEEAHPGWGHLYVSTEDIPVIATVSALAENDMIYGNIMYGQE